MPSDWINHIKKFASENNLSYACALSNPKCSETYKQKKQNNDNNEKKRRDENEAKYLYDEYIGKLDGSIIGQMLTGKNRFTRTTEQLYRLSNKRYKELTGKALPSPQEYKKQHNKEMKQYEKEEKIREQKKKEEELKNPRIYAPEYIPKLKKKTGLALL